MIRTVAWWTLFLAATFSLSKVFESSRLVTSESVEGSIFQLLSWIGALVLTIFLLGYESYTKSKEEGKVVHQVWLFEKLYAIQQGRHRNNAHH